MHLFKYRTALFFIFCLLAGFLSTYFLLQPDISQQRSPQQKGAVIVQVDDITAAKPRVQAIWILRVNFNEPGALWLLPLYQTNHSTPESEALAQSFALRHNGSPAYSFTRQLSLQEISWQHYLILDNTARQELLHFLAPGADAGDETILFQSICQQLRLGSDIQEQTAAWQAAAHHLHSDLTLIDLQTAWQRLNQSRRPICKDTSAFAATSLR